MARETYQFPRRLTITRQGKIFVAITVSVGVAALNTGNNLLFLCLGLMLSIITVSGILSELNVRDLTLELRQDALAVAGEPHSVEVILKNPHARRTIYALSLQLRWTRAQGDALLEKRRKRRKAKDVDGETRLECAFLTIAPASEASAHGTAIFSQRGEHAIYETLLETEFPFGLFRKVRLFFLEDKTIVAPAPLPTSFEAPSPDAAGGEVVVQRPGQSVEIFDLRDAVATDDIRHIAWAKSAARGQLVTIRRAAEANDAVMLALPAGRSGEPAFEQAVSRAAGLLHARLVRGAPTGLLTDAAKIMPDVGAAHERQSLILLALAGGGADTRALGQAVKVPLYVVS